MELDSCLTAPLGWRRRTIGDICEPFTSGGTPSRSRPEFYGGYVPWVKTKELTDRTLWSAEEYITEAGLAGSSAKLLPAGTILMAMYGATVAKLGRLGKEMACNQACAAMVVDKNKADASYLYFQLKLNRDKIVSSASGAAQQNLSGQQIRNFILPFPEVKEQRRIGRLLASLDDKIELNRRTNATLEAMAQAIFRDWFVDFGPVRRKLSGETDPIAILGGLTPDPAHAAELAALFPDSLNEEGLPKGWNRSPLLKVARLISGGTPKTDRADYWNGDVAWASAKDVSQCGDVFLLQTERTITSLGLRESPTKVVPRFSTVVVARGATTGRSCMFGRDIAMNQTCYALESQSNSPFWLNCAFKSLVEELVQGAHGSVFDTITTNTFERASTTVANDRVIEAFEEFVRPLFHRVLGALEENRTLAEARDYLLPRLMSGEVRAPPSEPENAAA